ncbi:hypothetical protein M5X11_24290 [Paenibacillus alginolyticus]|uniref:Uncharacterized protein n=1 Tax=Paenibacillus alginolyticus TaxID=59839 RepID=A0ABT4GPI7_9BACL|nr:hypothetical protein [Paenibacillus alginolyticus]MCY9668005.1 hypothetical protein [Paenibacillus alginolyticus]MCY9698035.1 hypothetical protein [Paenibacillus alginolyticus]MEC0147913.1 hypothetical protein [Paenibacillus alginolyticus]
MIPIAHYLFAIAFSGYYNKKDWQNWADKRILREVSVEDWLINISLASNIETLSNALSDLLISERHNVSNLHPSSDAIIGYFYLKHLDGKLPLPELLLKSGDEADGGEGASVDCEEFYAILNALEKDTQLFGDIHFQKKLSLLYEPFRNIAEQQKEAVENY